MDYVATGTVATAVLFSSVFPAMFGTFVKYKFQRTYDAILAAPVDTEELVTAEVLWIAARAGIYGWVPLLVGDGLRARPGVGDAHRAVHRLPHRLGLGVRSAILVAAILNSIDNFNYVTSIVITPMLLVAGTFFPLDQLPEWVQVLAHAQPALPLRRARARRVRSAGQGWADRRHVALPGRLRAC